MADVRSLLRAERAARAPPKSQKQSQPSKKRKADDQPLGESNKRTRAEEANDLPAGFFDGALAESTPEEPEAPLPGFVVAKEQDPQVTAQKIEPPLPTPATSSANGSVPTNFFDTKQGNSANLDDEWAAFERDIAATPNPPRQSALDAINRGALISAAPLSAEQLVAQAREEQSTQRESRAEEIEAEKEDAARNLEEEFEEMEALEERVKRLREKRALLKKQRVEAAPEPDSQADVHAPSKEASDDDDDDEGDEWDGWRFGTS